MIISTANPDSTTFNDENSIALFEDYKLFYSTKYDSLPISEIIVSEGLGICLGAVK